MGREPSCDAAQFDVFLDERPLYPWANSETADLIVRPFVEQAFDSPQPPQIIALAELATVQTVYL